MTDKPLSSMDEFPRPILAALEGEVAAARAGLVMATPELRAVTERALAFARASSGPLEVDVQGAIGALLAQSPAQASAMERLVNVWIARGGASLAIRASVEQRKLVTMFARDARRPGGFDRSVRWLESRKSAQLSLVLDVPTWDTLHAAAKRAKRDEKRTIALAVSECRVGVALALRCWLDGIAPEPRAAVEDIDEVVAHTDALAALAWTPPLFPGLALESSEITRRAGLALLDAIAHDATATARLPAYAKDVVALLGADAGPRLVAVLAAAHAGRSLGVRELKRLAEALLDIDTEPVAQFFGTMVESQVLRPIAAEYMQRHASHAVRVLGPIQKRRAASEVLREIAQRQPDAVREGLVELAGTDEEIAIARKAVDKTLRQTAGSREATSDELPWILRDPPWRRTRPRPTSRTVAGIPAIAYEEQIHLLDGDVDEVDASAPIAMLARDGTEAIATLVERAAEGVDDALFFALRRVESPRVAPVMAAMRRTSRRPQADNWLGRFAAATTAGLLPIVLGGESRQHAEAAAALLSTIAQGRMKAVRRTAALFGDDVLAATNEWLTLAPLYSTPERAPRLPAYADAATLPRIALENGALIPSHSATFVAEMMYFSDPDAPYAGLELTKSACDARSLDAWLVALMRAWADAGAQPAGTWVLFGLAQLGGADAMRDLARDIKTWQRSRETRPRAIAGLEALAAGNATARTTLADFARKGLRGEAADKAEDLLRAMARKRGLSEDDIADSLTPTLDLESNGTCVLDYGPRKFTVSLDEHLAACITDDTGARLRDAPRIRKTDDPLKARAAHEQLKSLKKGIGDVARGAVFRFENAMTTGRRYRRDVFDAVAAHPILGRVARRLLWIVDGEATTFRIAEDGTLADETDRTVEVARDEELRVVHPLAVDASLIARWSDRFGEYELLQPFPQLGRATFTPTPEERTTSTVRRFAGIAAPFMAICGRLESRGWRRSNAVQGTVSGYYKRFAEHIAMYDFAEPIVFGESMPAETTIGIIRFAEPLERIGAIVFSEAAYDLHVFAAPR